ncbi:MAG TPA: GDP-mannose 4,6-dehydratase [Thermoanaerobaculia bacterium]|nr:GDP-mannose 4,6-dehydratase [Thermoanaerobaculia bacterium]
MKKALLTGITGQDGSYLAELLLEKGYEVWGLVRRSSDGNTSRIEHLVTGEAAASGRFRLAHGDLGDSGSLHRIIAAVRPDEVYNLAAQSDVRVSFEIPEETSDSAGSGVVRLLEAIRQLDIPARFYQASSSEMFGKVSQTPQNETTPFHPRSPYAVAKVFGYHMTRNYREAYGMFAVNGILFNHESPRRGENFVTRKISRAAARIKLGLDQRLRLGNLDAKRDWGYAADYVDAMWRMLQTETPADYVVATGRSHSVREFCDLAFGHAGMPLRWSGEGIDEKGVAEDGRILVEIDPEYFRPSEVDALIGDATKARERLGWSPQTSFEELVRMMVEHDLAELEAATPSRTAERRR